MTGHESETGQDLAGDSRHASAEPGAVDRALSATLTAATQTAHADPSEDGETAQS